MASQDDVAMSFMQESMGRMNGMEMALRFVAGGDAAPCGYTDRVLLYWADCLYGAVTVHREVQRVCAIDDVRISDCVLLRTDHHERLH